MVEQSYIDFLGGEVSKIQPSYLTCELRAFPVLKVLRKYTMKWFGCHFIGDKMLSFLIRKLKHDTSWCHILSLTTWGN